MTRQRTDGMATIGTVNIIFGATSCLIGALMAFGSNFMPGSGAATGTPDGRFLLLAGLGTVGISFLLLIGGIGVRRVAPWGRSLSVSHGALGVIVYGAALIGAGFDLFFAAALTYSFAIIGLFSRADWKAAFSRSEPVSETPPGSETPSVSDEQTRAAA